MSSFSRWQSRINAHEESEDLQNGNFIFQAYPSTTIVDYSDEENTMTAVVVNKQEKDEAYIYTHKPLETETDKDDDFALSIGSTWVAKGLYLLVDEEIIIIKDVPYHKYHALLCNIEADDGWWYFKNPDYINVSLREGAFIKSLAKPTLVTPGTPLNYNDKVTIKGRAWLVQEFDNYTHDGVTYYSLTPTTMSKEVVEENEENTNPYIEDREDIDAPDDEDALEINKIIYDTPYTLTTEDGYFAASSNLVEVVSRTSTSVTFTIPFGVIAVTISTKSDGEVVETTYTKAGELV